MSTWARLLRTLALLRQCWRLSALPQQAEGSAAPNAAPQPGALDALLASHLLLERAMDGKLQEVVVDTERSALDIIQQVRHLYDAAHTVVVYLESSSPQADALGGDIVASVRYLVEIGAFIEQLPAKMARDMEGVASVVQEIKGLNDLVGSVQAISMQSHLLAINAAIEGSRAGPSGAAFRIIAQEMRKLASDSGGVAQKINAGLSRARHVVESGMSASIAESEQQIYSVSHAVGSIQKLQDNFEDMSQYFKTRFAVITKQNEDLAHEISEVLGHIQYQDVVSQCIERMRQALARRNDFLEALVHQRQQPGFELGSFVQGLDAILEAYTTEEEKHKHSARHLEAGSDNADGGNGGGELKFELF